jgi:HEAT repeat protein
MKVIIATTAALLVLPATALALSFESLGNAPLAKKPGWTEGLLDVVNLNSRVYSLWQGEAMIPTFFYQGDIRALNEAIKKFAAIKADERQLILLPGRGKTHSFDRKPIDFDWRLHLPTGRHAVMTAYVNAEIPRGPLDRKKAQAWLRDLDDDSFATRQAASRGLEKLGIAAKPFLREALKRRPPLEVRRRIEALLANFKGLDVGDLEIPTGVTVVTTGELLEAHLKDLSGHYETTAMSGLVALAPYSDKIIPALTARLEKGKSEYIRRVAAYCLGNIGAEAKTALPALKAGLGDPDVNIRTAYQAAIDQIEKARPEPGWDEEVKKRIAIVKDLDEWKKGRGK